jgi:hypothetical protein
VTLVEPALVKNVVPFANSLPSDHTFSVYGKQTVNIGGRTEAASTIVRPVGRRDDRWQYRVVNDWCSYRV